MLSRSTIERVLRFCLVGAANTGVYYVVYRLLLLVMPYLPAHVCAFAVGMVFSFFANCAFTYRVRPTWRRFLEFPATVAVNFVITTFGSVLLVHALHVDPRWATLLMTVVAIPFTYLATTFVLARPRAGSVPGDTTATPPAPVRPADEGVAG